MPDIEEPMITRVPLVEDPSFIDSRTCNNERASLYQNKSLNGSKLESTIIVGIEHKKQMNGAELEIEGKLSFTEDSNTEPLLSDNSIKGINDFSFLSYSQHHKESLGRGELWLFPNELEDLLRTLKHSGLGAAWSFIEVPSSWRSPLLSGDLTQQNHSKNRRSSGLKKQKKKNFISGASNNTASGGQKKKKSQTYPGNTTGSGESTTSRQPFRENPQSEKDHLSSLSLRSARASQTQIKRLPDWAQRLHRTLVLLSQTEVCRPFVPELSPTDPRFADIYDAIQPALIPMGLSTVISKLEQNAYQSALDVFNDVYSVWLCAYRVHPPGSPSWIQTYHASRTFLQQIANQPLRDDFASNIPATSLPAAPHSSGLRGRTDTSELSTDLTRPRQSTAGSGSGAARSRRQSANVDQLLQEFLTLHEPTSDIGSITDASRATATFHAIPRGGRGKTRTAKRKQKVVTNIPMVGTQAPITEAERLAFQNYLSQLQAKHHLMLFEAFRRTAVWRSIESGEVELDDAKTAPPIFRKMIAWCKSQLAVQLPADKRRKIDPATGRISGDIVTQPDDGMNTNVVSSPCDIGSGKFVPAFDCSTGGKLTAQSYIQARNGGEGKLNGSSSSSSCSSSSSDEDDETLSESESESQINSPTPNKVVIGSDTKLNNKLPSTFFEPGSTRLT